MASERVQRQIDRLLDQAEEALQSRDWAQVRDAVQDVLYLDPDNQDAPTFLAAAERAVGRNSSPTGESAQPPTPAISEPQPTSAADGRYKVSKFLGEGGKKKVYLVHDETLDRDVAFALIMRLLEKDALKRATTASEALQALDSLDGGVVVNAEATEVPSGPDPVYRCTFVGRETELKNQEGIFDGAISGNGALVMVVGEPGIDNTSITEQLATYVAMRCGKTLVGHCYEEGSLYLPYLAFVESIPSYVLAQEPDDLKQELGTGAGYWMGLLISNVPPRETRYFCSSASPLRLSRMDRSLLVRHSGALA